MRETVDKSRCFGIRHESFEWIVRWRRRVNKLKCFSESLCQITANNQHDHRKLLTHGITDADAMGQIQWQICAGGQSEGATAGLEIEGGARSISEHCGI